MVNVESEINTKLLEKWELYGLGAVHGGVLLFVLYWVSFLPMMIQEGYLISEGLIFLEVLLFVPFSIILLINIYNILKKNKLSKLLSYINLVILLIILVKNIAMINTMDYIEIIGFSIPSFLNIIYIKKYGEYPTIKVKDIKQIQREKLDEKTSPPVTKVDEELLKEPPKEKAIFVPEFQKISDARETVIEKADIKTTSIPKSQGNVVDVKTAFGYKGATIIYKTKIENNTPEPISDIRVYPYVPNVFLLKEKEKSIALIEPKSSQTVTFEIRPTGECGDCNVSGRVNYYDMVSKKHIDIELEPKSLSIICPMLRRKEISEDAWRDLVSGLVKAEETTTDVPMDGEGLFGIISEILRDLNLFMLPPGINKAPQIFRGTARFYGEGVKGLRYAAQIEVVGGARKSKLILKAWAEKEDALTGFYHGVLDEIEKRVKVKEYIDDSIVQYNIHYGDKIGTLVKDSVVQRSTIGASARKCPNCGREVEANEKFCLECGAKLNI